MAWHWKCDKPLAEPIMTQFTDAYIDGLVQDCSISSVLAMEILQPAEPSISSLQYR